MMEGQPPRFAKILKNTRRWYDPVSETELLENVTCKNTAVCRTNRSLEETWKATVHDKMKKVRTPKPIAAGAGEGAVEADAAKPDEKSPKKPLGVQTSWLEKQIGPLVQYDSLKQAFKDFNDPENQIWAQYIPTNIRTRTNACIHKLDLQREELVNIKGAGEAVDFKAVQDALKLAMRDVAESNRKAMVQWEEAWNMLTEDEQNNLLSEKEEFAEQSNFPGGEIASA